MNATGTIVAGLRLTLGMVRPRSVGMVRLVRLVRPGRVGLGLGLGLGLEWAWNGTARQ